MSSRTASHAEFACPLPAAGAGDACSRCRSNRPVENSAGARGTACRPNSARWLSRMSLGWKRVMMARLSGLVEQHHAPAKGSSGRSALSDVTVVRWCGAPVIEKCELPIQRGRRDMATYRTLPLGLWPSFRRAWTAKPTLCKLNKREITRAGGTDDLVRSHGPPDKKGAMIYHRSVA